MTKFLFIRHGEPDYSSVGTQKFNNRDFAPLTEKGRAQIKMVSKDYRLEEAEMIISSPYVMAYESARILSRELQLKLVVEKNLYEWLPDKRNEVRDYNDFISMLKDYRTSKGNYPSGGTRRWEDNDSIRQRASKVFLKYESYKTVIVVSHALVIEVIADKEHPGYGEIIEYIFGAGIF
jgi:uncharacterized phosphatase